jgi:hypothetical protein
MPTPSSNSLTPKTGHPHPLEPKSQVAGRRSQVAGSQFARKKKKRFAIFLFKKTQFTKMDTRLKTLRYFSFPKSRRRLGVPPLPITNSPKKVIYKLQVKLAIISAGTHVLVAQAVLLCSCLSFCCSFLSVGLRVRSSLLSPSIPHDTLLPPHSPLPFPYPFAPDRPPLL